LFGDIDEETSTDFKSDYEDEYEDGAPLSDKQVVAKM